MRKICLKHPQAPQSRSRIDKRDSPVAVLLYKLTALRVTWKRQRTENGLKIEDSRSEKPSGATFRHVEISRFLKNFRPVPRPCASPKMTSTASVDALQQV